MNSLEAPRTKYSKGAKRWGKVAKVSFNEAVEVLTFTKNEKTKPQEKYPSFYPL